VPSPLGQTLDPLELAANKVLTVYDRPRARDADDIARLVPRFGLRQMLDVADRKQVEPLARPELANAFRMLQRIKDGELPYPENAIAVKHFMGVIAQWLESGSSVSLRGPYHSPMGQQPKAKRNGEPNASTTPFPAPSARLAPQRGRGGICGARTKRGGICHNPAGSCPYH